MRSYLRQRMSGRAWWERVAVGRCCACLALVLAGPQLCEGVQAQEPGAGPVTLHVSAQLVLVDASVEMKKTGKPVIGLGAGDFVVAEDGMPQTISSVSEDVLPLSLVLPFCEATAPPVGGCSDPEGTSADADTPVAVAKLSLGDASTESTAFPFFSPVSPVAPLYIL